MLNHLIDFSVLLYSQPEVSFQSVYIGADLNHIICIVFPDQCYHH